MGFQLQVWIILLMYLQYKWVRNPMRTGKTERRTGMKCVKRTECEMGSQDQDEKWNNSSIKKQSKKIIKERFKLQKFDISVERRWNKINMGKWCHRCRNIKSRAKPINRTAVELDCWAKRSKQSIDTWLISIPALKCDDWKWQNSALINIKEHRK